MAINVNIPGVGNVQIENAAQESTLQALIAAVKDSTARNRRVDNETGASLRRQAAFASDAETSLSGMARSAGQASSATSNAFSKITEGFSDTKMLMESAEGGVLNFSKNLAFVAADISRSWAKNFSTLRVEPIQSAAGLLTKGINVAASGMNVLSNVAGKLPGAFGSVPKALGKATADVASTVLHDANQVLAQEYMATARSYKDFSEMGASFANGLSDIRGHVNQSGLTFEQYTAVIKANREDVRALGGTLSDGSYKVSQVMGHLATQTGSSGKKLREELLNMGIGLEEQGAISINYMANMRQLVGQDKLRGKSEAELAQETRKYAESLKVLSEVTGKDAKAVMEKARQETMRAGIMSTLSATQQKSLMDTFGGMEAVPDAVRDNVKNALMQQLTGGTITDPVVAQSKELTEYIKSLAKQVQAGTGEMTPKTIEMTAALGKQIQEQNRMGNGLGSVTDKVVLFGGGMDTAVGKLAAAYNALGSMTIEPGAVQKSIENMRKGANSTDELTNSFTKTTIATNDFARTMSNVATKLLPEYADILRRSVEATTTGITAAVKIFTGEITAKQFLREVIATVREMSATNNPRPAANSAPREARAKGGPVVPGQNYLVGEKGPELFIPKDKGTIIPGAELKPDTELKDVAHVLASAIEPMDSAQSLLQNNLASFKTMQESFANNLVLQEKQKIESDKKSDVNRDSNVNLPGALTEAFETVLAGPSGFRQAVELVKEQLVDNNQQQQSMLQAQIDRLNDLVSAMQDNVRASENIANVLG